MDAPVQRTFKLNFFQIRNTCIVALSYLYLLFLFFYAQTRYILAYTCYLLQDTLMILEREVDRGRECGINRYRVYITYA